MGDPWQLRGGKGDCTECTRCVSGSIAVHSLERLTAQSIQKDACRYSLSIDADLREALDWGVKQLFVYVVAEYETTDRKRNQLVVWDRIIETEEDAKFSVQNVDPKSPLIDDGTGLRAADVRFSLHYEQVPISGLMRLSALGGATFVAS